MIKVSALALVAALSLVGAAQAQSAGPQIPNPANPFPEQPIATDGSKLSLGYANRSYDGFEALWTGRSSARDGGVAHVR